MLQGIGYTNPYSTYSRIQYPKQNEEALRNLPQQREEQKQAEVTSAAAAVPQMDLKLDAIKPRTVNSLEDISLSLKQPAAFEMKGSESDIEELDITKAVSDMNKDEALQQYQFFVGSNSPLFESEDGVVVAKPTL